LFKEQQREEERILNEARIQKEKMEQAKIEQELLKEQQRQEERILYEARMQEELRKEHQKAEDARKLKETRIQVEQARRIDQERLLKEASLLEEEINRLEKLEEEKHQRDRILEEERRLAEVRARFEEDARKEERKRMEEARRLEEQKMANEHAKVAALSKVEPLPMSLVATHNSMLNYNVSSSNMKKPTEFDIFLQEKMKNLEAVKARRIALQASVKSKDLRDVSAVVNDENKPMNGLRPSVVNYVPPIYSVPEKLVPETQAKIGSVNSNLKQPNSKFQFFNSLSLPRV